MYINIILFYKIYYIKMLNDCPENCNLNNLTPFFYFLRKRKK